MADEPPEDVSKSELWQRLRRLEQAVFPSRRDVLKAGAGAAAGGVAGALLTGGASAGSAETGQIGSATYPQDAWIEDLYDHNDNKVAELPGDGSFSVDKLTVGGGILESAGLPPSAALNDTESLELAVRVPNGSTLEVYRWGAFQVTDGTAPTGLDCELLDGSDTVQASENTANTESDAAPVASHTNSSGTVSVFKLRAYNGTGAAIGSPGVSFRAIWRVA